MGFGQAISSGFNNITNFEGRASRPAFWWWVLAVWIINVVVSLIFGVGRGGGGFLVFLGYVISIVLWIATLAVGCRRLHDTGRSGWWQLMIFVCGIGIIVPIIFWIQAGTPSDNQYGAPPTA